MRTNLKVSFAEKDKVKALGARWDPALKVWYVENAPDLAPFAAWIPELAGYPPPKVAESKAPGAGGAPAQYRAKAAPFTSRPPLALPDCGCNALPWEHCEHSTP
jgi:hypothetical protein